VLSFLLWSSVYKSNSKSTPNTSATKSRSSRAATEGECWSQSRYDLTTIKSTKTFHRIPTVFAVGIRCEQVVFRGFSPAPSKYSCSFLLPNPSHRSWFVHPTSTLTPIWSLLTISQGHWRVARKLIPDWTYSHCPHCPGTLGQDTRNGGGPLLTCMLLRSRSKIQVTVSRSEERGRPTLGAREISTNATADRILCVECVLSE